MKTIIYPELEALSGGTSNSTQPVVDLIDIKKLLGPTVYNPEPDPQGGI